MSPRRIAKAMGLLGVAALAVVIVVTVWVVRHRDSATALQRMAKVVPGTLLHARNFKWTQMKGGHSRWRLSARDASYSDDKTSVILTDARLSVAAQDGKSIDVTAPHAEISVTGNHVKSAHLSGGLRLDYGDLVMTTDQATFVPDQDIVTAPGEVKIIGKGLIVTGVGLSGHPKERTFTLLSQTSTQVTPKKARETEPGKS